MERYDVVIIGGGFFGCSLAAHIKTPTNRVLVLEKETDLMSRASYNNQARVHGGYHYTRSLLTALRSRMNFADFVAEYEDCIDRSFAKYYAVARQFSKVSAAHFYQFCKRIGAEVADAPVTVKRYFNDNLIEDVFTVEEYAFDSRKIREKIRGRLEQKGVEYRLQTEAQSLRRQGNGLALKVEDKKTRSVSEIKTPRVFNCTYSQINKLNSQSDLPLIRFKHELTEMMLVEMPDELKKVGITVMDGPFFSAMPFPSRGLHTLSHVRYTPHVEWRDGDGEAWRNGHDYLAHNKPASAFRKMLADVQRYMPILKNAQQKDSLWEVKTVLQASENDDSRPILFKQAHGGVDGYTCIMGGKLDNIQDVLREIDANGGNQADRARQFCVSRNNY